VISDPTGLSRERERERERKGGNRLWFAKGKEEKQCRGGGKGRSRYGMRERERKGRSRVK
jgi:hypothetical protein